MFLKCPAKKDLQNTYSMVRFERVWNNIVSIIQIKSERRYGFSAMNRNVPLFHPVFGIMKYKINPTQRWPVLVSALM